MAESYRYNPTDHVTGNTSLGTNKDKSAGHSFGNARQIRLVVGRNGLQKSGVVVARNAPWPGKTARLVARKKSEREETNVR